ncbi:MAG: ribonuclease J [Chloroflexi bacterium]|nr:ribonuclease J [Chloroflexota bacterium]|tara:strand:+ start:39285 stop:40907 length:1623 start_codon:yes stop_codon:yes gene_type:complete
MEIIDSNIKIIPLGGLGEIGKNMMVIEQNNELLIIDAGGTFPDEELDGVNIIIPNIDYLEKNHKKIKGLLITHGHEDHIAAIPYLIKNLKVPIYAPKFAVEIIKKKKLKTSSVDITTINIETKYKIGNFNVKWFEVCHSIPDSNGICIETNNGNIIHTGDFKIDHNPIIGNPSNLANLANLANNETLLLMADSTNAEEEGYSSSDKEVFESLFSIISKTKGRVFVCSFASLISRMQMISFIAKLCKRKISFAGRSMINNSEISENLKYLDLEDNDLPLNQCLKLPDNQIIIMITGSQGETSSSLVKLSNNDHKKIKIKENDTVIMSASVIPGNELGINKAIDDLVRLGAKVITNNNLITHTSGHGKKEELRMLINLIKPKNYLPIHGDYRMLKANYNLAKECGIKDENVFLIEDGEILELNNTKGQVSGSINSGEIYLDNNNNISKHKKYNTKTGVIIFCSIDYSSENLFKSIEIKSFGITNNKKNIKLLEKLSDILKSLNFQTNSTIKELEYSLEKSSKEFLRKNMEFTPMVIISTIEI